MKQALLIFGIFLVFFLLYPNEKVQVVNYQIDYNYSFYTVDTEGLNTNNFFKYIQDNIKVFAVYPKINKIYKNKIGNYYYEFDFLSNKHNIEKFTHHYKNILRANNYSNDYFLIDYYGINIEKIIVYTNKEQLNNLLSNCSLCTI